MNKVLPMLRSLLLLLFWAMCYPALAQHEYPGGSVTSRPVTNVEEKGQHPEVIVQTVPHLDVTATCLAIRYRAPLGTPLASTAHLYEHLLFRSAPGGQPGALLLRSEELGSLARAQVGPSLLMFSELVPAEKGLDSLELQLSRLQEIPRDPSGIAIERRAIGLEIRAAAASPEEQARRELLRSFGLSAASEGDLESLREVGPEELREFLLGLNLETDVVMVVIGPHTNRQVRQRLSKTLRPLLPQRKVARVSEAAKTPKPKVKKIVSNYSPQRSYFFRHKVERPGLGRVAEAVLRTSLGSEHKVRVEHEDGDAWRVDVSPPTSQLIASDLMGRLSLEELHKELELQWLERWESPLARAELMATSKLEWGQIEGPPQVEQMPTLVAEALALLKSAQEQSLKLELTPKGSGKKGLFPYRRVANRGTDQGEVIREQLPNGLQVSHQTIRSWPIVAVSGFFRLKRHVSAGQARSLKARLEQASELELDFEIRPGGLFFHTWCKDSALTQTLDEVARVLKAMSQLGVLEDSAPQKPTPLEEFFIAPLQASQGPSKPLKTKDMLNPKTGQLVIVGDIDESQLQRGLRPAWSGWFPDNKPSRLFPSNTRAALKGLPNNRTVATAGGAPLLLLGFQGPARSNPDFLAYNLALQTLAGRPTTSILARQLRDRERLVDSVRVFPLVGSSDPAVSSQAQQTWLIALRLASSEVNIEALLETVNQRLNGLVKYGLPEAELRRTRAYLKGQLKLSTATTRGRAQVLTHAEFHRLSESYSRDYAGLYDNLKSEQVKAATQSYLTEPKIRWLYLKPGQPSSKSAPESKTGIPDASSKVDQ